MEAVTEAEGWPPSASPVEASELQTFSGASQSLSVWLKDRAAYRPLLLILRQLHRLLLLRLRLLLTQHMKRSTSVRTID